MIMHPNLSLVITQGKQRVSLISGYVIYQAAIFSCIAVLHGALCLLLTPLQGQTFKVTFWEKGRCTRSHC